jgi:hypothetical protein
MVADGSGRDSDANWLVISGQVTTRTLSWRFEDPCLMTTEARELASWLGDVASGSGDAVSPWFVEPNIELRVAERSGAAIGIRFLFRHESAPPGSADEVKFNAGFPVDIGISADDLRAATDEWVKDLLPFPPR